MDTRTKAFRYRQGIQAALLHARVNARGRSIDKYLERVSTLSKHEKNKFDREPIGYDYLSLLAWVDPLSLDQEIEWLTRRIKFSGKVIRAFLEAKSEVEECFVKGDYQQALDNIDQLDEKFGVSLWSVSLQVAIRQSLVGIDGQKAYVASIRKLHKVAILPYLANYTSQLAEPTVSLGWYRQNLKRRLTKRDLNDTTLYLESKLSGVWPVSEDDVATCLRVEQNHHEIDIYESFVGAIQHLLSIPHTQEVGSSIRAALHDLSFIGDERLIKANSLFTGDAGIGSLDSVQCISFEALLAGNVHSAHRTASRELRRNPSSFYDMLVLAITCETLSSSRRDVLTLAGPTPQVVSSIRSVLRRSIGSCQRVDDLEKLGVMFGGLNYGSSLFALGRIEGTTEADSFGKSLKWISLHLRELGAFDYEILASVSGRAVPLEDAVGRLGARLGRLLSQGESSGELGEVANRLGMGYWALSRGQHRQATDELEALPAGRRWLDVRAASVQIRSYAQQGRIEKAAELISRECCVNHTQPDLLPIRSAFDDVEWHEIEPHCNNVATLNALQIYSDYTNDDKIPTFKRFAIQSFIRGKGIQKPSELKERLDEFAPGEIGFFFDRVCVPQQIDMLRSLRGSRKVLEERRSLCSLAILVGTRNVSVLEAEILAISRELTVQDGLRTVDGSRVHVDRVGIKKKLRKELAESFERYTSLVGAGVGVAEDFDLVFRDLLRNDGSAKYLLSIPENEADEILASMVASVKDKFLLDIPYGLDSYLSKRIRHGSIVGHIRGPAEEEHIVLQRNLAGEYVPDGKLVANLSPREAEAVNKALADFSRTFDSHLLRLKDVLLHVRTAEHQLGVFDLSYNSSFMHLVRSAVKTDMTLDGLLESLIALFWSLLAPSVAVAKSLIENDYNRILSENIESLKDRALYLISDPSDRVRVGASIGRALTGVQGRLSSAAAWFEPSKSEAREYSIEESIEIGIASVKAIRYGFDPQVDVIDQPDESIPATYLPVFVDILFIIFGNIAAHSNAGNRPSVTIRSSQSREKSSLTLVVDSEVKLDKPLGQCEQELHSVRESLDVGDVNVRIREEGGSGLAKLASIVGQASRGRLEFRYVGADIFRVEVDLSLVAD